MEQDSKKLFRNLALANFALAFGFNIWQAVFNNFAVDELAVDGLAIGWLQSIREIPVYWVFCWVFWQSGFQKNVLWG